MTRQFCRDVPLLIFAVLCAAVRATDVRGQSSVGGPHRLEITFPTSVRAAPVTGRVYVIITRNDKKEPRLQLDQVDGIPFFGRDVQNLAPGAVAVIDDTDLGFPVDHLRDIPPGDYYVQAFVNVYSEFRRADGNVVWMHDDQWEGQRWEISPGNLYSRAQRMHLDAASGYRVQLSADQEVPAVAIPPDTDLVKRFEFQSTMLTKFWGRPIYLGATVLLPRDYAKETISYPGTVLAGPLFAQRAAPVRQRQGPEREVDARRLSARDCSDLPASESLFRRFLCGEFAERWPLWRCDSAGVDSRSRAPFSHYPRAYARILDGGSTGGWESLALQLFHPDFFGATWSYCPDPVTFEGYEGIDIYKDDAFYKQHEWYRVPTTNIRDTFGEAQLTVQQKLQFELVNGTR